MSKRNNQTNIEYYLEIDDIAEKVSIKKYVFDSYHPNGEELTLVSIGFHKLSGYSCPEAKALCENLLNILEHTDWRRERNAY